MFKSLITAALLPSLALAQGDYATGLVEALNGAGLTTLATALGAVPASLLEVLQQGNRTVFAPSNEALAAVPQSIITNPAALANVIAYHIAAFPVSNNLTFPQNKTIVRSLLRGAPSVLLPGNQPQVLVLSENDSGAITVIDGAAGNVTSQGQATYRNLQVEVIPAVLTPPGNISSVLTSVDDVSALSGAVSGLGGGILGALDNTPGLTVFAPVNSAFGAISDVLASANQTTITNVVLNHIINGTAVYSSLVSNGASITSAGGQTLSFAANDTGVFVTSGGSSARIIQTDIIVRNGVIHLIDGVLLNTESNPDAAASAASSFSSAQATLTDIATAPIGATGGGGDGAAPTGGDSGNEGSGAMVGIKGLSAAVVSLIAVGVGALLL